MSKPLIAITGASSGIGEAAARAFSAASHPLLLVARRLDRRQPASHVADMILFAYQMPQNVLIQERLVTPTRQEY